MNTTTATQRPADVEALMRALRLPHARAIAADVLATARAQRWVSIVTWIELHWVRDLFKRTCGALIARI